MTDAEQIALAQQAQTMLKNDAFTAALDKHRQNLMERFAASSDDVGVWHSIRAEIRALAGLRAALDGLMTSGDAIIRRAKLRTIA